MCADYHVWSQGFGDASPAPKGVLGIGVAVDGAHNVIAVGDLSGSVNFGGMTLTSAGSTDVVVAKFSAAGKHTWSKRFGDAAEQHVLDVAADAAGNSYLIGRFEGTMQLGPKSALTSMGSTDVFVIKLDPSGNEVWSRRFGDAQGQVGFSIAVDGGGHVIVAGLFAGSIDFGGAPMTAAGYDVFLAKLSPQGDHVWSHRFLGSVPRVAVDKDGNVSLAGSFSNATNLGGADLTSVHDADIFVAKFDYAGKHIWSKSFGGYKIQLPVKVTVDGSRNIILSGDFQSDISFDGKILGSSGEFDVFVAKLDPQGKHLWSKSFGDGSSQSTGIVTADEKGNVVFACSGDGTLDFGGGPLVNVGPLLSSDIFVAKFDPAGGHLWSKNFGDSSNQWIRSVATDGPDDVLMTGDFEGVFDFGGAQLINEAGPDMFVTKLLLP